MAIAVLVNRPGKEKKRAGYLLIYLIMPRKNKTRNIIPSTSFLRFSICPITAFINRKF
jgi:hypothetical protein